MRRARRSSTGPVWIRHAAEAVPRGSPPEVGFAIGRPVGHAVERNRLRRRLRALMADLAPELAPGAYLVGAGPASTVLSYAELGAALRACLAKSGALSPAAGE
ncbi:MAG: ribonuclease P protein component [Actinobacteria bacterium]|nr:ribonuclease P protein component [Actinomycetota bacterium]